MIALIDGDLIAYRCAASCEPNKEKLEREPLEFAKARTNELMFRILNEVNADPDKVRVFLSSGENFRHKIDPKYKVNRKDRTPPTYLDHIRNMLLDDWDATICVGYEADDGLGMAAKSGEDFVICSIDKDLLQIPGTHYNFVKSDIIFVDDTVARYNFWSQVLIGDTSDNIEGCVGIGKVKAERLLKNLDPDDYEAAVIDCYISAYGPESGPHKLKHAIKLLRVLRSFEELVEIEDEIMRGEEADFSSKQKKQGQESTEISSDFDSKDFSETNTK